MEGRTSQLNKDLSKLRKSILLLKARRKDPVEYERMEMPERKGVNRNARKEKKGEEIQNSLVSENIYIFFLRT